MAQTSDHEKLVAALRALAPSIRVSNDPAWTRATALRVIDCVLSLDRNYDRFIVPRLERFERAFPAVRSVTDLQRSIARTSSSRAR